MRNYQIYPYFLRDGVVLHDTGVGTVPNKQNFAPTAKRCPPEPEIAKLIFTCLRKSIFTDVSKVKDLKSVKGLYDGINVQITYKTECM